MAVQHFRSALNGFNRQDVVNYIEYLVNQHNAKIQQLNTQLELAQSTANSDLQAQLDAALARCAQLEEQLGQPADGAPCGNPTQQELEAYRRAERAERLTHDRAQQIYTQANSALADATCKAEAAADQIGDLAQQAAAQLQACQDSLLQAKDCFQQTIASLYAIHPEE